MSDESKTRVAESASLDIGRDAEAERQRIGERIHFLFRKATDNRAARELEKMILVYRMDERQP